MNMQEMSTAVQYRLPIKIFILNNEYMGMVRQWQVVSMIKTTQSYTEALPRFVKLAESVELLNKSETPDELDEKIKEMISSDKPVIFDCVVDKVENCYPMIPSGKPHNEMLLGPEDEKEEVSDEGKNFSLMVKSKSAYFEPTKFEKEDRHIIVVWVDNEAGVLARVIGLFFWQRL